MLSVLPALGIYRGATDGSTYRYPFPVSRFFDTIRPLKFKPFKYLCWLLFVIPAKAGIQKNSFNNYFRVISSWWGPVNFNL